MAPKWLGVFVRDEPEYRRPMYAALSVGSLLLAFLWCSAVVEDLRLSPSRTMTRAAEPELEVLEAIALVQDWRAAGDPKTVLERLAGAVRNPAYPRAWSAERTEADSFLVLFREPSGVSYAFEVNLEAEDVQPTPEAVEALTMLRVREEAEAQAVAALAR